MPLTARLMLLVFSMLPIWLSIDGLVKGWIAPPMGRPRTRRIQPVQFWTVVLVTASIGVVLILVALLA